MSDAKKKKVPEESVEVPGMSSEEMMKLALTMLKELAQQTNPHSFDAALRGAARETGTDVKVLKRIFKPLRRTMERNPLNIMFWGTEGGR